MPEIEQKELYVFIESLIDGGKSEDEIFMSVADKTSKGILSAVRTYKQFMKDTGRALSAEEKKQKVKLILDPLVKDGSIDLSAAINILVDELNVSTQSARGNIQRYCEAVGVIFPARQIISKEDIAKYADFVEGGIKNGASKKEIILKLVSDYEVETGKAEKIYYRIAKEKGLLRERSKYDIAEMATYVKSSLPENISKTDFCSSIETKFQVSGNISTKIYNSWIFALAFEKAA